MAAKKIIHPVHVYDRADDLSQRAVAIARVLSATDGQVMPDGSVQKVAEQLAEMFSELGGCAQQLFEAWSDEKRVAPASERTG